MQSISIRNLGPISEFAMDIKDFSLLIGEQATGKSTISKSVYFFHVIKEMVIEHLYDYATDYAYSQDNTFPKALNKRVKGLFVELFGYSWNLDENLHVDYSFADDIGLSVFLSEDKKYISIQYSNTLIQEIRELEHVLKLKSPSQMDFDFSFANSERIRIREEITRKICSVFDDDYEAFYIPAGRQILTLLGMQKTKLDYDTIDYVNRKFMQINESIQPRFEHGIDFAHKSYPTAGQRFDIARVVQEMKSGLKGDYQLRNQRECLVLEDNSAIPINYASSGQQEALWMYMQLYILMLRGRRAFVIIEEPEAHLYPSLQKSIMEFIAQFVNINRSRVIVTTHSPYILSSANVLYYAGRLGQMYSKEVSKIVHKDKWIAPEQFSAWKLASKGSTIAHEMIDSDLKELRTSMIDEVSDAIGQMYSALYYCEADHEDAKAD